MKLIDKDAVIELTWEEPSYTDPLNVLTEVRDRIKELPTVDAVPVDMIKGRINDFKKMLMDISEDEWDVSEDEWNAVCDFRTRIETLTELLEMWAERKEE